MPRLRFLRPSTGLRLEKRGIYPRIWSFIGRFLYLCLFARLLLALISASLNQWSGEERSAVLLGEYQIEHVDAGGEDAVWIANQPEEAWNDTRLLLWTNGPYAFILSGGEAGLDLETMIRVAENLKW